MYIVSSESETKTHDILNFMPRGIRQRLYGLKLEGLSEIRMRLSKPLTLCFSDGCYYIGRHSNLTTRPSGALCVTRAHIDEAMEIATASSVYSVRDEIKNGFITVRGGHRIGITGTAVVKEDKVTFIKDVSALCYRIANEVTGAADSVMPLILDGGRVRSTLIIAPPAAGKTTMLRDIVRQLSRRSYSVSVVDERREIAALSGGRSGFDLGHSADILEGADKSWGMLTVLRSMSPDVIVTDEIGKREDVDAISRALSSGVSVIATVHGRGVDMIKRRADLSHLLDYFELVVTLSRRNGAGTVEEAVTQW